jgi:YmgG-like glycine-zipper protein
MIYSKIRVLLLGAFAVLAGAERASAQSVRECEFYAQDQARRFSANGQVLGGAGRGALLGAGVGAISGRAGRGAAIGAGVGAVSGGARRSRSESQIYQHAFRECMAGRARWT